MTAKRERFIVIDIIAVPGEPKRPAVWDRHRQRVACSWRPHERDLAQAQCAQLNREQATR